MSKFSYNFRTSQGQSSYISPHICERENVSHIEKVQKGKKNLAAYFSLFFYVCFGSGLKSLLVSDTGGGGVGDGGGDCTEDYKDKGESSSCL
jgi:hypothetical protein